MANNNLNRNKEVTSFLDGQNHPLREEIEQLRTCILSANNNLTENIKWNGPNYSVNGEDRITMKIQPPKNIQLIFHRGAKKQEQPKGKIIEDDSKLLAWRENDRAIASFKTCQEIETRKAALTAVINKWIAATQ